VDVQESDGTRARFTETSPGTYQLAPGSFVGQVGNSYQLFIRLQNGDEYLSSIETIQDRVNTLSGEAIFVEEFFQRQNGTVGSRVYHEIDIDIENENENHYFISESSGWAEVEIGYGDCGFFEPPAAGPNVCWSFRERIEPERLTIGSNEDLSSENYKISAATIPFDAKRNYVAIVKINSMSPENYSFWQSIDEQLKREGGIFDRPIAPIIGNIVNVTTNEPTLGYFHAYSTSQQVICFDRSQVQAAVDPVGPIPCVTLCTTVWDPATFDNISNLLCQ
jgi:hypothetical protein